MAEDFDFDELYEERFDEIEEDAVITEEIPVLDKEEFDSSITKKKYIDLIFKLASKPTWMENWKKINNYDLGPTPQEKLVSMMALADITPDEGNYLAQPLVKFIKKGVNSMAAATNWLELNRAAACAGQLEFAYVGHGRVQCMRAGYWSTPFVPTSVHTSRVAKALIQIDPTDDCGLRKRVLHPAIDKLMPKTKVQQKASDFSIATSLLMNVLKKKGVKENPVVAVAGFGNANLQKFCKKLDFKLGPFTKLPKTGLFSSGVADASQWAEFFRMTSVDNLGPVDISRIMAAFDFPAYVGDISGISDWLQRPVVLKTRTRYDCALMHSWFPLNDMTFWPASACFVGPQSADLEAAFSALKPPSAMVVPVMAMAQSNKIVELFCKHVALVTMSLVVATVPHIMLTANTEHGVSSLIYAKNFANYEAQVCIGLLCSMKTLLSDSDSTPFVYDFIPASGGGPGGTWKPNTTITVPHFRTREVGEKNATRVARVVTKFAPEIDAKFADVEDESMEEEHIPTYRTRLPRWIPPPSFHRNDPFYPYKVYDLTGSEIEGAVPIADYAIPAPLATFTVPLTKDDFYADALNRVPGSKKPTAPHPSSFGPDTLRHTIAAEPSPTYNGGSSPTYNPTSPL
jgi:hypothetical protein